jgi:hypothetical protein
MRRERYLATPRRRSPKLLFLVVVVMLCYAAVWLGGKTWAHLWRWRQQRVEFVPAFRYNGLGAGGGHGTIPVHVMNCASSSTVEVNAYDATDLVEMAAASSKIVSTGESDSLHCAGEGMGYCKMTMSFQDSPDRCYGTSPSSTGFNLDVGKWAIVKGFEITTYCRPIIEQIGSQPASCEDICGNCS